MTLPPNLYTDTNWAQAIAWLEVRYPMQLVVPSDGTPYFDRRYRNKPVKVSAETLKIIHDYCFPFTPTAEQSAILPEIRKANP